MKFTVGGLVARHAANGVEDLMTHLGPLVFIGPAPPQGNVEWSYRTASVRSVKFTVGDVPSTLDESYLAFPVRKSAQTRFANTILIGRSDSNDIALAHSSVSKLHARARLENGVVFLSDAESSNGTAVDGLTITGRTEIRLMHGSLVRLGEFPLQLFETEKLVPILEQFLR